MRTSPELQKLYNDMIDIARRGRKRKIFSRGSIGQILIGARIAFRAFLKRYKSEMSHESISDSNTSKK